ncbi:hypothetical protein [Streptomyces sp. NPDC054834]
MTSAVARGLAAVVVVATLAGVAGCKDKKSNSGVAGRSTAKATGAEATMTSLFPGRSPDEQGGSAMHLPSGTVGESVGGKVAFVNTTDQPMTINSITATSDNGQAVIAQDACTHVKVLPGDSCEVVLQHIASDPGRFTVALTARTDQGPTFAARFIGEAVGPGTTSPDTSVSTTTPGPTTPSPPTTISPSLSPSPSTSPSPTTSVPGPTDSLTTPTPQPDATETPTAGIT